MKAKCSEVELLRIQLANANVAIATGRYNDMLTRACLAHGVPLPATVDLNTGEILPVETAEEPKAD